MSQPLAEQVLDQMKDLPARQQRRVLEFVRALAASTPTGVPGKKLVPFAGTIPADQVKELERLIDEGCERIDVNGW
ncbi:MAG: hypothetical protein ACJ8FY_11920 [Gemmataceae bacterium]